MGLSSITFNREIKAVYHNLTTKLEITKMELIYSFLVKTNNTEFLTKVKSISAKLNIDPNHLMAVMYIECTLDHTAVNRYSGATGLIQFMPATAKELGTTTTQLQQMTNVQQLDYVYKYLLRYKGRMSSFRDIYLSVFFPAAMGKESDYEIKTSTLSAALIAKQNPAYDLNHDNVVTVYEVETALLSHIKPEYHETLKKKSLTTSNKIYDMSTKFIGIALAVLFILSGALQLYKTLNS